MMATTAELRGIFPPEFTPQSRVHIDVRNGPPAGFKMPSFAPFQIEDARPLQALAVSPDEFFDVHGFFLLSHETAVRNWESDPASVADSDVVRIYYPEIEQLIRERLYPGRRLEVHQWSPPLRRGRGTPTPQYANGVHSDYALTPEDFEVSVEAYADRHAAEAWRRRYERDEVEAFVMVDFWRPTNMPGPLMHMPLAVCDPSSVEMADLVPTALTGIAPSGLPTNHVALRYNPRQRWYYYPRMDNDEVLAFKLFECRKSETDPREFRSVLHSAFVDPDTPADAAERQSCEHRVGISLLRN
jgi:hypothetical protein